MTHSYQVSGITCSGCVAKVKWALEKVPGVKSAAVQIEAPQATITMDQHISTAALAQALRNVDKKYVLSDQPHSPSVPTENAPVSYFPIYLIFGFIAAITLVVEWTSGGFEWMRWMTHFMAGFFLVFSFSKLLNVRGFAEGYATYDLIAKRVPGYGLVYPFIEVAFGLLLLIGWQPVVVNAAILVVMSISSIGVVQSLLRNSAFECACLGTVFKLPLGKVTVVEDLLMVAMSAAMLVLA